MSVDRPTWNIPIEVVEPGINTIDMMLMTERAMAEQRRTGSNGHENGKGKGSDQKKGATVFEREGLAQ
ncbi:hypothetical protein A2773_04805 [Candidatus Gottesmanbacteria bacterium RIFCSPHIGHO2_01_FULL_39_10]|uniref:Uncharacterized protein n=1 Tax=Candidatus Gottesmanbacteria bacterium RIFCSPHIGHO2_01_FULL_39_10 TaxID=1798375 RepID=A0A1F5ZRV2_9BACT|nr:MAG: hypothetical protein A2773_04805 [Candidatus Gottesmanbacteria bacterium RIFCSPHIGHO2_01_FULL_39_10]